MTPDQIAAAFGCFGSPFSVAPAIRATPSDQEKALRHLERHGTPTHTGYPFMQLAKATGAAYGDVLLYAEWWKTGAPWTANGPGGTPQQIEALMRTPCHLAQCLDAMLRLPIDQRGGDHYPDKAS